MTVQLSAIKTTGFSLSPVSQSSSGVADCWTELAHFEGLSSAGEAG